MEQDFCVKYSVKVLFNYLSMVSLMLGAIIGAGFLSGAEPVSFFGTDSVIITVVFGVVVMSIVFSVCFYAFKKLNDKRLCTQIFASEKLYGVVVITSAIVFTASMLAGIDALWNSFGVLKGVPVLSTITIIAIGIFVPYGVKGLEKLNLVLMPLIIIGINLLIFNKLEINLGKQKSLSFSRAFSIVVYVFINLFISIPVMIESAKNKTIKTLIFSTISVALLIGVQLIIILGALSKTNYLSESMPLLIAINTGGFSATYFFSLLFGTVTSAFSAYYPVYEFAKGKGGKFGTAVSAISVMIISRLGLESIVKYLYPLVALFGVLYFISLVGSIKIKVNADNKNIQNTKGRTICQKRKRIKIKLSN